MLDVWFFQKAFNHQKKKQNIWNRYYYCSPYRRVGIKVNQWIQITQLVNGGPQFQIKFPLTLEPILSNFFVLSYFCCYMSDSHIKVKVYARQGSFSTVYPLYLAYNLKYSRNSVFFVEWIKRKVAYLYIRMLRKKAKWCFLEPLGEKPWR